MRNGGGRGAAAATAAAAAAAAARPRRQPRRAPPSKLAPRDPYLKIFGRFRTFWPFRTFSSSSFAFGHLGTFSGVFA